MLFPMVFAPSPSRPPPGRLRHPLFSDSLGRAVPEFCGSQNIGFYYYTQLSGTTAAGGAEVCGVVTRAGNIRWLDFSRQRWGYT